MRRDGLRAAGVYPDAQTNDARLCLANVRAAADAGAAVANRAEVVAIDRSGADLVLQLHDRLGDEWFDLRAAQVVNATGAAVDALRRLEDPAAGTSVVLSKGAHLVLDPPHDWRAALTIPVDRSRVSFAIPWEGLLLLGTTDSAVEPGDDALDVTAAEERQILDEAARGLDRALLAPDRVRARFAGLRVLPSGDGATAHARREVVLSRGRLGVLSVAGGKLTTYRLIAGSVLRALGHTPPPALPLPGACDPATLALDADPRLALHLARTYGTLARDVLACDRPDALEPLAPGAPDVVAQAVYARDREWAHDADDVLRRRTTLALRGLDTPEVRERVRALLAEPVHA
jgi:glycerol-3-phosphate dehydrogenase